MPEGIRLIAGNSNIDLAREVAVHLKLHLTDTTVKTFSDGEIFVMINDNVRGADTFVIQSTCNPVNNNLVELLLIIDALKRASAGRITAVLPYYGYGRQDRKVQPRVPISSKLVADILEVAGANRILAMDLHAGQIQGFFNIPVDHLYATPVILSYLSEKYAGRDLVTVSPDAGGVERARAFANRLNSTLAIVDKRREKANVCEVLNVIGDVKGRDTLICDDMIDTAGTTVAAANILKEFGAKTVSVACTHPVLSGPAIERLQNSSIDEVIVTNTIPLSDTAKACNKIKTLSVAYLLGEAISRIHHETSINSLFV